MSKNRLVFIVGILLLLIPLMGFPRNWENFFHIVFGVILVALSFSVSIKQREKGVRVAGRRPRSTKQTSAQTTPVLEETVSEVIATNESENERSTSNSEPTA